MVGTASHTALSSTKAAQLSNFLDLPQNSLCYLVLADPCPLPSTRAQPGRSSSSFSSHKTKLLLIKLLQQGVLNSRNFEFMGRESPGVLKHQIRNSGSSFPFLSTKAEPNTDNRGKKNEGEIRNQKIKSNIHFLNIQFLLRACIYLSCTHRATRCHLLCSTRIIRRVHLLLISC